jgi:hypothetical protein
VEILSHAYGQNASQVIKNNTIAKNEQSSKPSIVIFTGKPRYMLDEHVIVYGTINNRRSSVEDVKMNLRVTYVANSTKGDPFHRYDSPSRIIYYGSIYTTNNSFRFRPNSIITRFEVLEMH